VGGIQSSVAAPVVSLAGALLLLDATVVFEAVVVVDGAVVLEDVLVATEAAPEAAAVFDAVVAAVAVSTAGVRSIVPTLEDTRLAAGAEPVDAEPVLLDPSPPPQAAKVSVARVHRTAF
jgi:hypothetical protein